MNVNLTDAFFIKLYILTSVIISILFGILSIYFVGILLILPIIFSYLAVTYLDETRWINEGKKFDDMMIYFSIYATLGLIAFGIVILIGLVGIAIF
jgi:hypothetical protein